MREQARPKGEGINCLKTTESTVFLATSTSPPGAGPYGVHGLSGFV